MSDAAICEAAVRAHDYDRFLSALFAPASVRPHLFALYAFYYEVARTAETVRQPLTGQIRLQWWRDAIAGVYAGKVLKHPVLAAFAAAIAAHGLPQELVQAMIDAREADLEDMPFADLAALEAYADATSGHVMRLSVRILDGGDRLDALAREAGIAYALAGLMRALPFHAARGRAMLPADLLSAAGASSTELLAGRMTEALGNALAELAQRAKTHLAAAHSRIPRAHMPALLPAALVPLTLKRFARRGFDPFREGAEIPRYRRQLALLAAMARAHL